MINRFKSFCLTNHLISPKDFILVALSGGMDSMALLHAFLRIKDEFELELQAIHVNHGIRGQESERDEQFVRQQCQQLAVPLIVRRLNVSGKTDERTLRQARYAEFEAVLSGFKSAKIATGHTLNDNVETLLMRLAKGSSLKGLTGIPVKRGPYIRPFLFLERNEINSFIKQNQIPFVEDSSNLDLKYLRNQVRHKLVPVFVEIFGKEVLQNLARSMDNLSQFYQLFETECQTLFEDLVKKEDENLTIDTTKLKALPALYRQQILTYCISNYYPLNYKITDQKWLDIERFVQKAQTGARLSIKNDLILLKERDRLRFAREPDQPETVLSLDKNSTVEFGGWLISLYEVEKKSVVFDKNPNNEFICGDRLTFPLLVRNWKEGDRFYPLGLGKSQKLKDFFVNQKIEWLHKHEIPILLNGNEIVWVCGCRLDQRYRVTESCKSVFKLELKKRRNE